MKQNKDFIGDDNINWCQHAEEAIKTGIPIFNPKIFDYFQSYIPDDAICVEIGCNVGKWVNQFTDRGWVYFGIDASPKAVKIAKETFLNRPDVCFWNVNALNIESIIKFPVDLVFFHTVLQHMHHSTKSIILSKVFNILDHLGFLVIQETTDASNNRAFDRLGWIKFVEKYGFRYITGTKDGDPRNGFLFQKI